MNSVLLDTSFLISLSDPARAHHGVAQQFYKECIARRVPMFLSTVVISEYQVKQAINDLPLRNFIVLPFNVDHAMACGLLVRSSPRDVGDDRVRVKDSMNSWVVRALQRQVQQDLAELEITGRLQR